MKRFLAAFAALLCGFSMQAKAQDIGQGLSGQAEHLTMNQWVRVDADGSVSGRVFLPGTNGVGQALSNVSVAMKSFAGEIQRTVTNDRGEFTVDGVEPGVYAVTARGDDVFACFAMHVAHNDADADLPETVDVAVADVDFTVVNTAIIRYMPANPRSVAASFDEAQLTALAPMIVGTDLYRVRQTADGGMRGRIHVAGAEGSVIPAAERTNVFLFKDGLELSREITDLTGGFEFDSLTPGAYSILAIGPQGVGLIGFELINGSSDGLAATSSDGVTLVQQPGSVGTFAMQLAPAPALNEVVISEQVISEQVISEEVIDDDDIVGVPFGGGGTPVGGGFGGGGGGGGFFGGGFGRLAAIGGIAAAIALGVDDDDDDAPTVSPPAVSPSDL